MQRNRSEPRLVGQSATQLAALACLLLMGGLVLAGPSGLLAWSENLRLLEQRQKEVQQLTAQRDELLQAFREDMPMRWKKRLDAYFTSIAAEESKSDGK